MTQWETRNIATKYGRKFYWQILELVKGYRVPFWEQVSRVLVMKRVHFKLYIPKPLNQNKAYGAGWLS